jgi:hypothetical protein
MWNFMKILPVEAILIQAKGRVNGQYEPSSFFPLLKHRKLSKTYGICFCFCRQVNVWGQ